MMRTLAPNKSTCSQRYYVLILLVSSVALKLVLIYLFPDRIYPDVESAVSKGQDMLTHGKIFFLNSKTYLSPLLWYSHRI